MKKGARKRSRAISARREERIQHLSDLRMTYEGEPCEIQIRAPDLSTHGMFVNTATHFPEGAIVNLRFRLTRSNVEVQARSEVRYCLSGVGIGVEFVALAPDAVRAIESELQAFSRPLRRKRNSAAREVCDPHSSQR